MELCCPPCPSAVHWQYSQFLRTSVLSTGRVRPRSFVFCFVYSLLACDLSRSWRDDRSFVTPRCPPKISPVRRQSPLHSFEAQCPPSVFVLFLHVLFLHALVLSAVSVTPLLRASALSTVLGIRRPPVLGACPSSALIRPQRPTSVPDHGTRPPSVLVRPQHSPVLSVHLRRSSVLCACPPLLVHGAHLFSVFARSWRIPPRSRPSIGRIYTSPSSSIRPATVPEQVHTKEKREGSAVLLIWRKWVSINQQFSKGEKRLGGGCRKVLPRQRSEFEAFGGGRFSRE